MFEDDDQMTHSELNPLMMPKFVNKPLYNKDSNLEKSSKSSGENVNASKMLEEELKGTINDLEFAIAGNVSYLNLSHLLHEYKSTRHVVLPLEFKLCARC
jgi:hypothetical protein